MRKNTVNSRFLKNASVNRTTIITNKSLFSDCQWSIRPWTGSGRGFGPPTWRHHSRLMFTWKTWRRTANKQSSPEPVCERVLRARGQPSRFRFRWCGFGLKRLLSGSSRRGRQHGGRGAAEEAGGGQSQGTSRSGRRRTFGLGTTRTWLLSAVGAGGPACLPLSCHALPSVWQPGVSMTAASGGAFVIQPLRVLLTCVHLWFWFVSPSLVRWREHAQVNQTSMNEELLNAAWRERQAGGTGLAGRANGGAAVSVLMTGFCAGYWQNLR